MDIKLEKIGIIFKKIYINNRKKKRVNRHINGYKINLNEK